MTITARIGTTNVSDSGRSVRVDYFDESDALLGSDSPIFPTNYTADEIAAVLKVKAAVYKQALAHAPATDAQVSAITFTV